MNAEEEEKEPVSNQRQRGKCGFSRRRKGRSPTSDDDDDDDIDDREQDQPANNRVRATRDDELIINTSEQL